MNNKLDNIKTAALYIRVSTEKQEELSPESQKDKLLEYAAANGYLVPNDLIFWELGVSGRKAEKRPEFQRMIGIAKEKEHPIDAILVWKFSRFARNQEESIVYKSMLKKDLIDVISVSEYISDDVFGKLIERIIEWMDEYYSIRLSGDVFRGMHKKAELGGYQASPPLGYKIIAKGQPPIIDEPAAEIVKSIFNMYVQDNLSIFAIAVSLNDMGAKTKSGSNFQKRSVEYILKNITYCGYTRWNMVNSETKTVKDKSEWIIRKGNFEPIISEEMFEMAKNRLESEYTPKKAKPVYNQKHWLSGMVKCSACGRSLSIGSSTKHSNGKKYFYLQCYGYHKGLCTISHQISLLKIEPIILEAIKSAAFTGNFDFEMASKQAQKNTDFDLIAAQLKKQEEKENRIKQAYINGIDSIEEYKSNKIVLQTERKRLEDMLTESEKTDESDEDIKALMQKMIEDAYILLLSPKLSDDEKAVILRKIVSKIVFQKKRNAVEVYFRFL